MNHYFNEFIDTYGLLLLLTLVTEVNEVNKDMHVCFSNIYKVRKYPFTFDVPPFSPSYTNQKMPDQYFRSMSMDIFLQLVKARVL